MVCLAGLFVPLMDNDSAHHANIALHMYLTGDYVNLVDNGADYLDKPHLHFWLSALSYKIFGVTGFAYKFPSFLFSILGVCSVFRLGKLLYTAETGRLAALILASSFSFMLANNDVRMDAIITATIAFSSWQLAELILKNNWRNVIGAALGLALGFSTKGMIAVFIPALAAIFFLLNRRQWTRLFTIRLAVLVLLFFLFISPVLYCYYLQFNLHPEKIIRGRDHINGVKFILLNQGYERFSGGMGSALKNDYFFFIHSFLWAFAPWSLLALAALFSKIKNIRKDHTEWFSAATFLALLLMVSFSGFKLPHYLNISFPFAALFTAAYFLNNSNHSNRFFTLQLVLSLFLLVAVAVLNFWAFPVQHYLVMAGLVFCLSLYIYFIKSTLLGAAQKTIGLSVASMILCFFLLNSNFYPKLLEYQGGRVLAKQTRGTVDPGSVYFWKENISASYNFYTATIRKEWSDSVMNLPGKKWLAYYPSYNKEVGNSGLRFGKTFRVKDFEITRLDLKFINPSTRESQCSEMILSEILPAPRDGETKPGPNHQ